MALEAMHRELRAQLLNVGATPPQEVAWQEAWDIAQARNSEPLPCPACLVATDQISRVSPRDSAGGMANGRCDVCKAAYQWPEPD